MPGLEVLLARRAAASPLPQPAAPLAKPTLGSLVWTLEAEQSRVAQLDAKLSQAEAKVAALQEEAAALREGRTAAVAMVARLQRGLAAEATALAGFVDADIPEEVPSPAPSARHSLNLSPDELEAAVNQHQAQALEHGAVAGSTGTHIGGFLAALLRDNCPPQTKRRKLPGASGLALAPT